MIENLKAILMQMASYFSIYEIAILLVIFFVFIMFFTLALLLRDRKFIAGFFFFLSAGVIISTPFTLQFVMQKVLYKIDVDITQAHIMQYTKGFFVAGNITHKGKITINECAISVNEVRDEKGNKIIKMLNSIFPKSSSHTNIDIDIGVGEQKYFAVIVPHPKAKEPFLYRIYVDCYQSNKFAQKMNKKAQKQSSSIIKPQMPTYEPQTLADEKEEDSIIQEHIEADIQDTTSSNEEHSQP